MTSPWTRRACTGLLLVACRWGGPEGDLTAQRGADANPSSAPEGGTADVASAGASASTPAPAPGAPPSASADGATNAASGDGVPEDGVLQEDGVLGIDGSGASPDAGFERAPAPEPEPSCAPPPGLVCDPVGGSGCPPLTQCVVGPNAGAAAAYCVLTGVALGAACTQDLLSTSCPPRQTCIAGACRQYCYCDAQCEGGAACTEPSGQGGSDAFRLCAARAP